MKTFLIIFISLVVGFGVGYRTQTIHCPLPHKFYDISSYWVDVNGEKSIGRVYWCEGKSWVQGPIFETYMYTNKGKINLK